MNPFLLHPANRNLNEQSVKRPVVHNAPPHNTNEGSEFLDDAIRMEDLPLIYTEESVAAGSPYYLL